MASRRRVLSGVGVCLAGAHATSRRVSAESTTVRGTIESAVGTSLDGSEVEFFSPDINDFTKTRIEDGAFEATVEAGATYFLTFFHIDGSGAYYTDPDGVPLLYGLADDIEVTPDTTDVGSYELPEGYRTQMRFEDLDGNPVQHLEPVFRSTTGSGTGPGNFATNADGYVYIDDEADPGVELSGEVGVELAVPGGSDGGSRIDRITVTDSGAVTIPVRNPEEYGGVVAESSTDSDSATADGSSGTSSDGDTGGSTQTVEGSGGTPDEGDNGEPDGGGSADDHRGFLTNDPDSSLSFLDDPVSLTWAGIGVSIAGMAVQLFGRQS